MARYTHYKEAKHMSATTLAKHLRDELGLTGYTLERAKELTKQGMLDALVEEYQRAGLPLHDAPGWPWQCNAGQAAAPPKSKTPMTAGEKSALHNKSRMKQLEKDKDFVMPLDNFGQPLIDPMEISGPGFLHRRFRSYPALPDGQEYRVAAIFDPQGKESTQQTHLILNGRALIVQRDQMVFIPFEFIDGVVKNAIGKIDAGLGENKELNMDQAGSDLKLRPFRAEHWREIGEAVTDSKGVRLRWIRRFDGEPVEENPIPYGGAAPDERPHAG